MKTKHLIIIAVIFGATFPVYPQGYIVANGVTTPSANVFHVIQNPATSDYTGFALPPTGGNTFTFFLPFLDEGVRIFLVSFNQPISLQPILANSYTELTYGNVFASASPFYLGFYTGATSPRNGIYNDPLFGWALLANNRGTMQLLSSGLEYGGGGIYAGTQTIIGIPEPGTIALTALGTVLLGFHRWRKLARRI